MADNKLGKTGRFPNGKLSNGDEGEVRIGIGSHDGNVTIEFGTPVKWMAFPPAMAIELAMSIVKRARELMGGSDVQKAVGPVPGVPAPEQERRV